MKAEVQNPPRESGGGSGTRKRRKRRSPTVWCYNKGVNEIAGEDVWSWQWIERKWIIEWKSRHHLQAIKNVNVRHGWNVIKNLKPTSGNSLETVAALFFPPMTVKLWRGRENTSFKNAFAILSPATHLVCRLVSSLEHEHSTHVVWFGLILNDSQFSNVFMVQTPLNGI